MYTCINFSRDLVPSKMQSVPAVKDLPVEVATEKEVKKVAKVKCNSTVSLKTLLLFLYDAGD